MEFQEAEISSLTFNPFEKIGRQWMLITAGEADHANTMTASWGGIGIMWGKPVVTVYLRPQRYTKKFVDNSDYFTVSFLPEKCREALNVCGKISGQNVPDKWTEAGIHPIAVGNTAGVEEADEIYLCRKLYAQDMIPECFTDRSCDEKWYENKDYHTMYIAEIIKVLKK